MDLTKYLQSIKEISDKHLPKEEKIKRPRGRLVETEAQPLSQSTIDKLYNKYVNSAELRETWYNRDLPIFSNTKTEMTYAGVSKDELELIYIIPSVVVATKQFQMTYGHGTKAYNKISNARSNVNTSTARAIRLTLKECHSHAIQNEKGGIRLLPEFAARIAFCRAGYVPPGLEGKGLGEEVKNVFRTLDKEKQRAYSLNFFSLGQTSEEARKTMQKIIDDYLIWLTVAYDSLLAQETSDS